MTKVRAETLHSRSALVMSRLATGLTRRATVPALLVHGLPPAARSLPSGLKAIGPSAMGVPFSACDLPVSRSQRLTLAFVVQTASNLASGLNATPRTAPNTRPGLDTATPVVTSQIWTPSAPHAATCPPSGLNARPATEPTRPGSSPSGRTCGPRGFAASGRRSSAATSSATPALNAAWSKRTACLRDRGANGRGRSSTPGGAAPSTSTGINRMFRSSAVVISNATMSCGSWSRRRPCSSSQCSPIMTSSTSHELTSSTTVWAKSCPGSIESTSMNTLRGPKRASRCSDSRPAGWRVSERR